MLWLKRKFEELLKEERVDVAADNSLNVDIRTRSVNASGFAGMQLGCSWVPPVRVTGPGPLGRVRLVPGLGASHS